MKYIIKRLAEVSEDELCSVDPQYSVASLASLISAHNSQSINLENEVWFGHKDSYRFAPGDAPALVKVSK